MTVDYLIPGLWILSGLCLACHSLKRLFTFFIQKTGSFPHDAIIFWALIVLEYWYSFSQPRGFFDFRIVEFFLWSSGTIILYFIFLAVRRSAYKKRAKQTATEQEPSAAQKTPATQEPSKPPRVLILPASPPRSHPPTPKEDRRE